MTEEYEPTPRDEQLPPQDLEAEKSILGGLMLFNDYLLQITDFFRAEYFYVDAHQRIYRAILRLHEEKSGFDPVLVSDALSSIDELREIGGDEYLHELLATVPYATFTRHYAIIVREKWLMRQAVAGMGDTLRDIMHAQAEPEDVVRRLSGLTEKLSETIAGPPKSISQWFDETIEEALSDAPAALHIGLKPFDIATGGLPKGFYTALAARPGQGKTSLAVWICKQIAEHVGHVLFISLEMGGKDVCQKILAGQMGIDTKHLRNRSMTDHERNMIYDVAQPLRGIDLHLETQSPLRISAVRDMVRRHQMQHPLSLVVIDYLQAIHAEDTRLPRNQQVAATSRGLRELAKEIDCPFLVVCAMNRAADARENRRPRLSDLGESSAIEYDAAMVIFVDRPHLHDTDQDPERVDIVIAKSRYGQTGECELRWNGRNQSFSQPADYAPEGFFFAEPEE